MTIESHTFRFKVKDGKVVDLVFNEKTERYFDCSNREITTLEGCPKKVMNFYCSDNLLVDIKHCPEANKIILAGNKKLKDISDLPTTCQFLIIASCCKIKKFPETINEESLSFMFPSRAVRRRIKESNLYDVIFEDKVTVRVRKKKLGSKVIESI